MVRITFCVTWFSFVCVLAQNNYYQATNKYFSSTRNKLLYFSSMNGVLSSNSNSIDYFELINSKDRNIQSSFYENSQGTIWSSTYSSLIYKLKNKRSFLSLEMKEPSGNRINSDYKIFGQINNDLILKAGDYLFKYNTLERKLIYSLKVDLRNIYYADIIRIDSIDYLYFGLKDTLYKLNLNNVEEKIKTAKLNKHVYSVNKLSNSLIALGFSNGMVGCWDENQNKLIFQLKVGNLPIQEIKVLNQEQAVLSKGDKVIFWNYVTNKVFDSLSLYTSGECKIPLKRLIIPYVDQDSLLWIGSDGYGVVSHDLRPKKLKILNEGLCESNTLAIQALNDNEYLIISRSGKVSYFNSLNKQVICIHELQSNKEPTLFYKSAILLDSVIYLCTWTDLYSFNLRDNILRKLENSSAQLSEIFELKSYLNNRVIASGNKGIVELFLTPWSFKWSKLKGIQNKANSHTYFDIDEAGNIFSGYNEETLLYYKRMSLDSFHFIREYDIPGGVKCITRMIQDSFRYLATSTGMYKLNLINSSFKKVVDKEKILDQTIYAVYPHKEYLWLSSNTGILRLNPNTMDLHQFAVKDGLQGFEFNTFSYCFSKNGNVFFGGTNGVNYFNPDSVKLSDKEVPVRITDFRINDFVSDRFEEPDIIESIQLPYSENTISFEIISVDFNDQSLTRVKHKLEGIDKDFIASSTSTGIIRYANLAPGSYKLHIIGSNSDKVWNTTARVIDIEIIPPFWMTSWFRLLSIFLLLSMAYKLISDYYKRQLEKKNLLLKQQQLIIEKQEAVEKERTRIASEMHDDLGSGLTTIKYLSDRALKNATGAEERSQIEKIANQSNTLVSNMSEIIWAMNSRFDNLGNLLSYIRRYTIEYLEDHQIQVQWEQLDIEEQSTLSGAKRRSIFLVIKEALHNIVKHSEANNVIIRCSVEGFKVRIKVVDDGVGFDPLTAIEKGNGLYNMKNRMTEIAGNFEIIALEKGSKILIEFPLD